jgi:hypothetical protein
LLVVRRCRGVLVVARGPEVLRLAVVWWDLAALAVALAALAPG